MVALLETDTGNSVRVTPSPEGIDTAVLCVAVPLCIFVAEEVPFLLAGETVSEVPCAGELLVLIVEFKEPDGDAMSELPTGFVRELETVPCLLGWVIEMDELAALSEPRDVVVVGPNADVVMECTEAVRDSGVLAALVPLST